MSLLEEKVSQVLEKIKPSIQSHGGDLELVSVKGSQVTIKILGACLGCPYSQLTFNSGVEKFLKEEIPSLKKIKFVT